MWAAGMIATGTWPTVSAASPRSWPGCSSRPPAWPSSPPGSPTRWPPGWPAPSSSARHLPGLPDAARRGQRRRPPRLAGIRPGRLPAVTRRRYAIGALIGGVTAALASLDAAIGVAAVLTAASGLSAWAFMTETRSPACRAITPPVILNNAQAGTRGPAKARELEKGRDLMDQRSLSGPGLHPGGQPDVGACRTAARRPTRCGRSPTWSPSAAGAASRPLTRTGDL
jgi:hypothetical protein